MTARRALLLLIGVSALLRIVWASLMGLGNDEAYHYLFTVHRDWSYFDHPPMLALVESVGLILGRGSSDAIYLRIGFIGLFAGSTYLMSRLTSRFYGEWAGFWAAFALNASAYHTAAVGAFALPDGPLLFFWLLTLDRLASAFEAPEKSVRWLWVGLAWGCALLSKYHAVFLPAGAVVYLILQPEARRTLKRSGPYLAALVGMACFAPVIYWNATHGWASFAFQGGRAVAQAGFRPDALLTAILGQAMYLFPWVWAALLYVLLRVVRGIVRGEASSSERFLASQSVTPLLLFMAVACMRPILPHWTLVAYLSAFPLVGRWCTEIAAANPARLRRRAIIAGLVPILAACVFATEHFTGFLQTGGRGTLGLLKPAVDPTAEMYGWEQVKRELESQNVLNRPDVFLFTGTWYMSGQLAYATRSSSIPVVCYHPWDARSFGYWSRPESWVGKTGILVVLKDRWYEADAYARFFEDVKLLKEFDVVRSGGAIRHVRIYECSHQKVAFPFGNGGKPDFSKRVATTDAEPTDGEEGAVVR